MSTERDDAPRRPDTTDTDDERLMADSRCVATVGASIDRVDLTTWLFTLRDDEYIACSKAHLAAGASRTRDGKRMSINVERPGDTLLVQHYVEDVTLPDRCRVVSETDAFTAFGQTTYRVEWTVRVSVSGEGACTFENHVRVLATDHFLALLQKNGVPFAAAAANAQKVVDEHNAEETPLFARNVEAKAREGIWRRP